MFRVTIPAGAASANLVRFPMHIRLEHMPPVFWQRVNSTGGNIRALTPAGEVIPHDLVFFNPSLQTGVLFVRTDIAAAQDTQFHIDCLDPSEQALPPSDPNGRHAVWEDYESVALFGTDQFDRTGKNLITRVGEPETFELVAQTVLPNKAHQGITFDGTNYYTFDTNAIHKYDAQWNLLAANTDIIGDSAIPGVNHGGDGTFLGGKLYLPLELYPNSPYNNQHIAVFDADTLAFIEAYDISTKGHEASSLCYCDRDGLFYITDYTDNSTSPILYKYSTTGVYAGQLSVTYPSTNAADKKFQGIEWWGGAFWVTSDATDEVYRVEYDGKISAQGLFGQPTTGNFEGICATAQGLVVVVDTSTNSTALEYEPFDLPLSAGGGVRLFGTDLFDIKELTAPSNQFTFGCSFSITEVLQQALLSFRDLSSGLTNDRVTLVVDDGDKLGVWDNLNSWAYTSPLVNPGLNTINRFVVSYDGTSARKLFVDGALVGEDAPIQARGAGGLDCLTLGAGIDVTKEPLTGDLGFVFLRYEVLEPAWLAAEYTNLNDPQSFYSVATFVTASADTALPVTNLNTTAHADSKIRTSTTRAKKADMLATTAQIIRQEAGTFCATAVTKRAVGETNLAISAAASIVSGTRLTLQEIRRSMTDTRSAVSTRPPLRTADSQVSVSTPAKANSETKTALRTTQAQTAQTRSRVAAEISSSADSQLVVSTSARRGGGTAGCVHSTKHTTADTITQAARALLTNVDTNTHASSLQSVNVDSRTQITRLQNSSVGTKAAASWQRTSLSDTMLTTAIGDLGWVELVFSPSPVRLSCKLASRITPAFTITSKLDLE